VLFAADQILLIKSEDNLQYSVNSLKNIGEFYIETNTRKTKIIAFRGKKPIRSKMCIKNRILEQDNTFNYSGCNISYEGEKDLNLKITNFVKVVGIMNQIFKPSLVSRPIRIQIY
jgi:hypothetical protein